MTGLLATSSIFAAFLAGMVALSAPCCVTYLLPAYLASVYQVKRKVLAMTFVFAMGIAAVMLPITLGVAALSRLLNQYHTEVTVAGGLMLVALGLWSLAGRTLGMPVHVRPGDRYTVFSVFGLGAFSGMASSCCAPVLAGVLTLSAVASSLPQAVGIGLAYVFGMVFPLMVLAYGWDRFGLQRNRIFRGRMLRLQAGPVRWTVHSTNLVSGAVFLAIGLLILGLEWTGRGLSAPQWQTDMSTYIRDAADRVVEAAQVLPEALLALLVFGLLGLFAGAVLRRPLTGVIKRAGVVLPGGEKHETGEEEVSQPTPTP